MLLRIWFIVRYWIAWIILFQIARIAFLLSNYNAVKESTFSNNIGSIFYGLRMDMSMASYISLPVALFVMLSIYFKPFRSLIIYRIYTAVILLLALLLIFADIGLYKEWGFRIDTSFLKYLADPVEAWASISHLPVYTILISFIVVYILIVLLSIKILRRQIALLQSTDKKPAAVIAIIVLIGLFIIPLRGGFQLAPLNQSSVYFSQNHFSNIAALNAPWNFLHALTHNTADKKNPFIVTQKTEAVSIMDSLFSFKGETASLINLTKTTKPNVLIIVWESFMSKAIGLRRENKAIVPGFEKLINEGVYFSDIYATGDRTDKGIVGILSGYPAQPTASIIKIPGKASKLPMLPRSFKANGYHTSFYYGGELEFANMKAYLLQGKFDQYISINDFDKKDQNSKWGAHDGVVMKKLSTDMAEAQQPFFNVWLTLSSHEPYEIPANSVLKADDAVSRFLSSLHYSDSIVYDFIEDSRQQSWWSNTLVVIIADHGHRALSTGKKQDDFKIPMLLLGGALANTGITINKIGSQTDLAALLLGQLKMETKEYQWSKNLLDSSVKPWSYFSFNNGFGYIEPGKSFVFDNIGKSVIEKQGDINDQVVKKGRILQQLTFQDYLDK